MSNFVDIGDINNALAAAAAVRLSDRTKDIHDNCHSSYPLLNLYTSHNIIHSHKQHHLSLDG